MLVQIMVNKATIHMIEMYILGITYTYLFYSVNNFNHKIHIQYSVHLTTFYCDNRIMDSSTEVSR